MLRKIGCCGVSGALRRAGPDWTYGGFILEHFSDASTFSPQSVDEFICVTACINLEVVATRHSATGCQQRQEQCGSTFPALALLRYLTKARRTSCLRSRKERWLRYASVIVASFSSLDSFPVTSIFPCSGSIRIVLGPFGAILDHSDPSPLPATLLSQLSSLPIHPFTRAPSL